MRILHLSWEYPPVVYGGLGRHVHALAEAQAALGHEVVVITQGDAAADEIVNGVRVVRAPMDPPHLEWSQETVLPWVLNLNHALTRAALRLLPSLNPDVLHGHDWLVAHAGVSLRDGLGVPLVATFHATEAGRNQGWISSPLSRSIHSVEWWLACEASRLITCSAHMSREVQKLFSIEGDGIEVIPNGIDLHRWQTTPAATAAARERYAGTGPLLVFSGRLEWEKGGHVLLDTLPALRRRFPGLRLVVAGRGSKGEELARQARTRRLGRSVSFAGWLPEDELHALVAAADVAVVPSIYEPFGMVALEAAALGTPLVVTATGGLAEVVSDGLTGLTALPGDTDSLRAAITAVLQDEVSARRRARAARARLVADHDWARIAESTVIAYESAEREHVLRSAREVERPELVIPSGNLLQG